MSSKARSGNSSTKNDDEQAGELKGVNETALVRAIARYIYENERKESRLRQSRKLG